MDRSSTDFDAQVVILGGGVAGLWTLRALLDAGYDAMLLEAHALGTGQTVAAQGIIHGGLKYTLTGALTGSAQVIRDMPGLWRDCLDGRRQPTLARTVRLAEFCHVWRTQTLSSRMGMIGARHGLRVAPQTVAREDLPAVLARCPGEVMRLDEQVIDPASLLADLADMPAPSQRDRSDQERTDLSVTERILLAPSEACHITLVSDGREVRFELTHPHGPASGVVTLRTGTVVLAAGAGNADLLARLGLSEPAMQTRPLHMPMVRGERLPSLWGHCVDGAKTRVTITANRDVAGRTVWQLGGQVAEAGVEMDGPTLLRHARRELLAVLPGVDLAGAMWGSYRVDRAEPRTRGRLRPEDAHVSRSGPVITLWPTKLALAPRAAEQVLAQVAATCSPLAPPPARRQALASWPRPAVAPMPWEVVESWTPDASV